LRLPPLSASDVRAASTPTSPSQFTLSAALPVRMPPAGEVKRTDQPPIGGQINKPVAPRMVVRRKGARCGGASAPNVAEAGPVRRAPAEAPLVVRVKTGSAFASSDLAGYLRRCECRVEHVDDWERRTPRRQVGGWFSCSAWSRSCSTRGPAGWPGRSMNIR
jgi:hypothetical protein